MVIFYEYVLKVIAGSEIFCYFGIPYFICC